MRWRSTQDNWGAVAMLGHWVMAVTVIGLFALGVWMVDLNLYHAWYYRGPNLHKGIGMLLFGFVILRLLWRWADGRPAPLPSYRPWERHLSHLGHVLIYILLFVVFISGYLIPTADGRAIDVFGWFSVPATVYGFANQEDLAGAAHWYVALALIILVAGHALAALKHHFIDKDRTLKRMTGLK